MHGHDLAEQQDGRRSLVIGGTYRIIGDDWENAWFLGDPTSQHYLVGGTHVILLKPVIAIAKIGYRFTVLANGKVTTLEWSDASVTDDDVAAFNRDGDDWDECLELVA